MTDGSRVLLRLALVVHDNKPLVGAVEQKLVAAAAARGIHTERADGAELPPDVGVVVGIGGDGTLLRAAGLAYGGNLPVLGVNLGRVGYLADIEPDQIDAMLDGLVTNTLADKLRITVEARASDGVAWVGINDVVVEKVISQRVVQIGVEINGNYFTRYRADGLIVSTPLGSTAYSLSAGGPVVDPTLDALIMTPAAPHSLLSRSIVLSPDAIVRFTVELDRPARVNVDGRQALLLEPGEGIEVKKGSRPVRFLTLGDHPFPQAVRHQFGLDHA